MWPTEETTHQLLDRANAGDAGAVEQLLTEYREPLRQVIQLRLDPALRIRADASDIVQDVMVEANLRLREYLQNPRMPFHLWLRHMAQDRIIDTHRRHRVAQRRSIDREQAIVRPAWSDQSSIMLASQLICGDATPASEAIQQELQARLEQALSTLNEEDRDIILMRHHEQLSNQEVAKILELSEAAASMRYLRALRKLRAALLPTADSSENLGNG
ncbi:MAG: sigma-70 family RNA polymerase sigma factor [Zavarzinella sp.]